MEEEEKVPIIESVTSAQKIAKIDTKWITGKYTEHELMRFVVKRTARERRGDNQLGELVRQFQSLIISNDFIDTNWISSNSHLSHLKSLQDTEIQIIKKRKNSRLTDSEKQFIVKQIKQRGYSVKELLKKTRSKRFNCKEVRSRKYGRREGRLKIGLISHFIRSE